DREVLGNGPRSQRETREPSSNDGAPPARGQRGQRNQRQRDQHFECDEGHESRDSRSRSRVASADKYAPARVTAYSLFFARRPPAGRWTRTVPPTICFRAQWSGTIEKPRPRRTQSMTSSSSSKCATLRTVVCSPRQAIIQRPKT